MLKIFVKQSIIDYTKQLVQNNNFGNRGKFDGDKRKQFVGMLAENIIRDYLGDNLAEGKGFDGGWDVIYKNQKADVKCMERKVEPRLDYVNNVVASQFNYESSLYIFTSLNTKNKTFTVCGWIDKQKFKENANFYKEGEKRYRSNNTYFKAESDLWEIENKHLYTFE